jgi:hypothetical protein
VNSDHLKNRVKVMAVGVAAVGLASAGLGACSPPPTSLSCTTITSVAKNSTGIVTVKTLPGANVLTVANYGGASSAIRKSVTDSSGVTQAKFDLTRKVPGNKIDVAVSAVKGSKAGLCSATFKKATGTTTSSQPGTGAALTATNTVSWLPTTDWQTLPYNTASPSDSCFNTRPGTGAGCGSVVVSTLIKGFSGFGGTPACSDGSTTCTEPSGSEAFLSGTLELNWTVTCDATGVKRTHNDVVTKLGPAWQSSEQYVSPATAQSRDAALLKVTADLPLGDDVVACAGPSTLNSVSADALSLQLNPAKSKYPTWDFASGGSYTHP